MNALRVMHRLAGLYTEVSPMNLYLKGKYEQVVGKAKEEIGRVDQKSA